MLVPHKHFEVIENGKVKLFLFYFCEEQVNFKFCASYL